MFTITSALLLNPKSNETLYMYSWKFFSCKSLPKNWFIFGSDKLLFVYLILHESNSFASWDNSNLYFTVENSYSINSFFLITCNFKSDIGIQCNQLSFKMKEFLKKIIGSTFKNQFLFVILTGNFLSEIVMLLHFDVIYRRYKHDWLLSLKYMSQWWW